MFKILGVFFIILGLILKTYSTYSLKSPNKISKKKKEDLKKSSQSGMTFIFAGLSALVIGVVI